MEPEVCPGVQRICPAQPQRRRSVGGVRGAGRLQGEEDDGDDDGAEGE